MNKLTIDLDLDDFELKGATIATDKYNTAHALDKDFEALSVEEYLAFILKPVAQSWYDAEAGESLKTDVEALWKNADDAKRAAAINALK